ncbi:MAG TPA: tRNA pseudouridine(38-40) synthase TruA [Actinotalea caeni]|uniref:tRNA pseudouridine(38-40) synthase TruA n=1 Tax=Actinotalea caeni TaxID=1348467 RepID=UPI002B4B572C|nr:tRNA pseudouridine(38-40) synthase TruA [Actinotalea caeni]HLV55961.1 tRNA pseudouridine(38-40) synthase TruA [Actinotalea caeni]
MPEPTSGPPAASAPAGEAAATVRLRLDLGYDGSGFVGWAAQPGLRSVQGELERALATVLRLPAVSVTVAGRTDSGVHARGQVAHVDVPRAAYEATPGRSDRPPAEALRRRLDGVLPDDVAIHEVREALEGFDARFSAVWRRYRYTVVDAAGRRDPLLRGWQLWHPRPLDVEAMDAAARGLLGEHDFLAYCKPREGATTIRTLLDFGWRRVDGALVAEVRADAFCHSMVRSLVGASLAVGEGRWEVTRPRELLDAVRRDSSVAVAPPHGLVLEEVGYPPDGELAARAAVARSMRRPVR